MATWDFTLYVGDVFGKQEFSISEKAQVIADRIRACTWYDEDDDDLYWSTDQLLDIATSNRSEAEKIDEFDAIWDGLYDWADWNRVWIETHERKPVEVA